MSDDVYEQLAVALDALPNGFPRTPSNVEIPLLKRIFSHEEALLASRLGIEMESYDAIAERIGQEREAVQIRLTAMTSRGLLWSRKEDVQTLYRLAPFVVGIYEAQLGNMDHQLAHLVEEYLSDGGARGIMAPQPALHRVMPTQDSVKSEWILPYDDVRAILLAAKSFRANDCICRVQQQSLGNECDFPVKVCLSFSSTERSPRPGDISQDEALELLSETEAVGLVHTVSNVMEGVGYICNCCGCCCGILRGITDWGIEHSVAYANYFAVVDGDLCGQCGQCIQRCQVEAITEEDGTTVIDRKRCIGCGLCVTGCPNDAIVLQLKPEDEINHPPANFTAWEHDRLHNRWNPADD